MVKNIKNIDEFYSEINSSFIIRKEIKELTIKDRLILKRILQKEVSLKRK